MKMQHLIITRTLKNPTGTLQLTAIPLEPLNKIGEKNRSQRKYLSRDLLKG